MNNVPIGRLVLSDRTCYGVHRKKIVIWPTLNMKLELSTVLSSNNQRNKIIDTVLDSEEAVEEKWHIEMLVLVHSQHILIILDTSHI